METKEYIKHYQDKDWLLEEFVNKGRDIREIANELNVSHKLISIWLDKFNIS